MENQFFVKQITINGDSHPVRLIGKDATGLYWRVYNELFLQNITYPNVFKTDFDLNLIWQKRLSGIGYFVDMCSGENGDVILIGTYKNSSSETSEKLCVLSINNTGNINWFKKYDQGNSIRHQVDDLNIIRINTNRFIINSIIDLILIDGSGVVVNKKRIRKSSRGFDIDVITSDQNHIYIISKDRTLFSSSVKNKSVCFIAKFDLNLNLIATNSIKNTSSDSSRIHSGISSVISGNNLILLFSYGPLASSAVEHIITVSLGDLSINKGLILTDFVGVNQSILLEISPKESNHFLLIKRSAGMLYQSNEIYKLSNGLKVLWGKNTENYSIMTEGIHIIENQFSFFSSHNSNNYFINKSNLNLESNSCLESNPLSLSTITINDIYQSNIENPLNIENTEVQVTNVDYTTIGINWNSTKICPSPVDIIRSTISASPTKILANGKSKSTITVQLKDGSDSNIVGDHTVKISTDGKGNVGNTTNNGDGTYTTELTSSSSEETATLSFTIDSQAATKKATVEFYKVASRSTSTISASPTRILANGTSKSIITVQLKDGIGANIIGDHTVKISTDGKGNLGNTTNNGDGTYTAELTSSSSEETATLSFTIDSQAATKKATVEFYKVASRSTSTISASPTRILANGTSKSIITVQLKDDNGINIIGSQIIEIFSTNGIGNISNALNNENGTYTAELTSSTQEETAAVSFTIDGVAADDTETIFFYKEASNNESTIIASDPLIPANGESMSTITVQLKDSRGANIIGGHTVEIITNDIGILSHTINHGDGTYTAELTSSNLTQTALLTFTINGQIAQDSTQVRFYKEPDVTASTITADPPSILANGIAMTTVTVQLRDEDGTALFQSGHDVNIDTSIGSVSETINNNDGSYMTMLTSITEPTTATLTFTLNNVLSTTTTEVRFVDVIPISDTAQVQSPHIYLQAAGSVDGDGDQSIPGIHLRWAFKNKLGDEHLPKGNLATGTANFNKPGDYVKVYRAPYVKEQQVISLADEPQTIDHSNAYWLYTMNGNKYYVVFRDKDRYLGLLDTIDPKEGNRFGFLEAYGDGLIEVETRDQLAFGVTLTTNQQTNTSNLQTEILSVEANRLSLAKNVIGRKTFTSTALHDTHQCGDNIRSVRFKASNCYVTTIELELYQTFLHTTNEAQNWVSLGDFSLTTSDEEAFQRLENIPDTVHGKWPRYNNDCLTNLDNYRDKWNGPREEGDRNLKQIIVKYIELSNNEGNPRALETIDFTDPNNSDGVRDLQEVSNLNMLFLAGTDYHMARMMGLGHLDVAIENDDQKFVYMVEYHTAADLGGSPILGGGVLNPDGLQHLYMTVPTSKQDSRLPYPVDLLKIEPGIKRTGLDQNSTLTDPNGYTDVGRQRYVSIYAKEQVEHENEDFYETSDEFNYSEATHPVYAGISYKEKGTGNDWVKPEISSSADYLTAGPNPTSETVPLPIPLMGEPLFIHRILEEGTHEYLGYGINWFGRSNVSIENPLEIRTEFPAINLLKPPAALHALHVVEEDPLILTSTSEQIRVDDNTADDPTIARLMFSYNHEQELINYPISSDDRVLFTDDELLEPDAFRPDQNEIFANEIEIFFRNSIPQNIRGKIIMAEDDPLDQAVSVLTTNDYLLYSEKVKNEDTGEYEFVKIKPELPENTPPANFTGGILILGQQQFVIHSISVASNGYSLIKVYKKAVGDALQGNTTEGPLEGPDISGDEIFMAIENMLTIDSWGTGNPSSFKVQIPEEVKTIYRALVETSGGSDVNELLLEKFRGIYDDTVTITPVLETSEVDENNEETASIHRGTYKIQLSKTLTQHPQFNATGNSVEWQGGAVRIPSQANPNGAKRTLKVVKIENIGTTDGLILYAIDDTFDQEVLDPDTGDIIGYQSENPIQTTGNIAINFYPGYKVYLYADTDFGLTSDALQPSGEETLRYSIFSVRAKGDEYSHSESNPPEFVTTHYSNIGTPANMFSQAVIPPLRPQLPIGANYATRPDSFGKATYTLTTTFNHKPFAVQYSRADEQGILNALYESSTINEIKTQLNSLTKDVYATSRWRNLIEFDYDAHGGEFEKFPDTEEGYRFPNPDKTALFQLINRDIDKYNKEETPTPRIDNVTAGTISPGTVIIPGEGAGDDTTLADYIEKTVLNVFIPLTEIPLIYDQIRTDIEYQPINKKQIIRDRNGKLLKPTDDVYDIAPMAKRSATKNELQFTDFTLDGTSNNIYFYAVRELSSAMQMGDYSPVTGPINLVNTNPPVAPEIRRALPRLADKTYGLKRIPLDFVSVENLTITDDTIVHGGGVFGGASSKQILEGNAMISYQVIAESAIIIGLSEMHINKETETVDYGFISTHKGDLIVRDKGVLTTVGTYDSNTVLQIQRIGKILYFLRDGVEVYQIEIETPIDLLVTVSVRNKIATVTNLTLYTSGRYYDKEVLQSSTSGALPLTITSLDNSTFSPEGILAKESLTNAWDSSAISLEYIPFYGSLSFKVQPNKVVAVGLAAFNENRHIDAIEYGIRTSENGLLYVISKGEDIVEGIPYNEDSKLLIERRNQQLLFKNNERTFYTLKLDENVLLWADFSIYSADGTISDIEINETSNVEKNYLDNSVTIPAITLEFNSYPANQKITALSLYRTLDPAKSSSVRSMELVKTIDVRLTGQVGESTLTIIDEFEDLLQIPYGDAIYYRATVSREVSYTIGEGEQEKVMTELAPSNASRLIISTITESTNPITPDIFYTIDTSAGDASGENISIEWKQTVYNPIYYVYKMNTQGNWIKIHEFESNEEKVSLRLTETSLTPDELSTIDGESDTVFHHFRVDVENSAGLSNVTKNLITIPSDKLID
ncbi:Ig-like domain-containing protein [uncultured Dokdonia sp.]|uniref:Ig-like domain-containing protein n=1 Tax=uncultured Dokdonia sp. TaxID=575653 RepID=UPI0026109C80|nr:Ig-like domain-containing protein [uncultured Dokdonia sp.]